MTGYRPSLALSLLLPPPPLLSSAGLEGLEGLEGLGKATLAALALASPKVTSWPHGLIPPGPFPPTLLTLRQNTVGRLQRYGSRLQSCGR